MLLKGILGHEDLPTTQIYSHLQKENLIKVVKTLDNQKFTYKTNTVKVLDQFVM